MNSLEELIKDPKVKKQVLKYEAALKTLENQIEILNKEFEFEKNYSPIEHIKTRLKTLDSAIEKLQKRGYPVNMENIVKHVHDMVGVRIVCSFISDVYDIVDIIKKNENIIVTEEEDYIKDPKETGYTSYHMLVKVPVYFKETTELVEAEIQIRTISMDFWASLDHKIRYKFDEEIPEYIGEEIKDIAIDIRNIDKRMFKINKVVNKYKK